MKVKWLVPTLISAGLLLVCSGVSRAAPSANPPCPQIGFADGCNVQIVLNSGGTATITVTSQPAYDGAEDQLVGITNNSGSAIGSIDLSGSDIFGFDDDGPTASGDGCLVSSGNPFPCWPTSYGPTGYEGPGTSFNATDSDTGSVIFSPALANGDSTWFALEEAPSSGGFTVTGTTPGNATPEPGSVLLFATGLLGLAELVRRHRAPRHAEDRA